MIRVRPLLRRHALDVAAGAYALAFFLQLLLVAPGSTAAVRISELAFFVPGPVLAWLYQRNARLPGIDRRTRQAWLLLAGAALVCG